MELAIREVVQTAWPILLLASSSVAFVAAVIACYKSLPPADRLLIRYGLSRALLIVAALAAIAILSTQAFGSDCRHFFVKRQVVVQQVAVPVYVQPLTYYAAGGDIQAEALAEKVARLVENKLALRQQQNAQATRPAMGTFAKCIRCHNSAKASGGLALDGSAPTTCDNYRRYGEIFGLGENVPPEMQGVVAATKDAEKGAMNEGILRMIPADQPADKPPPAPTDGLE